jgi:hypothetical protein
MVAIYIAGFVILFAVATVVYKVCASLVTKSRTCIPAANLAHALPDEPLIVLGSSRRQSSSDLLLENFALRQELSLLRARHPKPRLETPDARALPRFRGQESSPDYGDAVAANHPPRNDGESTC